MITQDIIRKLWDEQGYGNVAVWGDGSMTVVQPGSTGELSGKQPLVILKPVVLVNRYPLLDFALTDEELLTTIEDAVRGAGGEIHRES